jgi:tetratricopeptide (TPR) repeat protein
MLGLATMASVAVASESPPNLRLGSVDFPTSGAPEAQPWFQLGVAAMHSFWFEQAEVLFRTAEKIDPTFAMAYWGEAMTHTHPYRFGTRYDLGRAVLARCRDDFPATARERKYIEAARTLFRDENYQNYTTLMGELHRSYPDDLEAAAFYALALDWSGHSAGRQQAAEIAQAILARNPNHPGAIHYLIHAYDDTPAHAQLALAAARRYARIAPDAPHALHMPSHIFLLLGLWSEDVAANEAGWKASRDWVQRESLGPEILDYHNLHWLIYGYLQQGRYREAIARAELFRQLKPKMPAAMQIYYDQAVAAVIVETARWDLADRFIDNLNMAAVAPAASALCGQPLVANSSSAKPAVEQISFAEEVLHFVRALSAVERGSPDAPRYLSDLRSGVLQAQDDYMSAIWRIAELEVHAAHVARGGDLEDTIIPLTAAVDLEAPLGPPPGPPSVIKPPEEFLGEMLLRAHRFSEARVQFEESLKNQPNRARSVIGLARAEAGVGDGHAAADTYARFLAMWQWADQDAPELAEAREYLQTQPPASKA